MTYDDGREGASNCGMRPLTQGFGGKEESKAKVVRSDLTFKSRGQKPMAGR